MISAYMDAVARDRAADRGCTGGGEVVDDVGPPGTPRVGFCFWWPAQADVAAPGKLIPRPPT